MYLYIYKWITNTRVDGVSLFNIVVAEKLLIVVQLFITNIQVNMGTKTNNVCMCVWCFPIMLRCKLLPEEWSITADTVVHPHFIMVEVDPTKRLRAPIKTNTHQNTLLGAETQERTNCWVSGWFHHDIKFVSLSSQFCECNAVNSPYSSNY